MSLLLTEIVKFGHTYQVDMTPDSYYQIYHDPSREEQARKLYYDSGDLEAVDTLCKSFLLADKAKKLLEESKLNKRFMMASLDKFEANTEERKSALIQAKKYIKEKESILENGTNLIIEGRGCVGTGKTFLSCGIAQEFLKAGIPCKFINVTSMVAELKESFDISEFINVEVLVIDDLGKERGTPWVAEQIYAIINSRYERELPIIITTENSISDLKPNYADKGKAILDRLIEKFVLIKLTGDSYRQKR